MADPKSVVFALRKSKVCCAALVALMVMCIAHGRPAYGCGSMGGGLVVSNIGSSGDFSTDVVLDLAAVVHTPSAQTANCTVGMGMDESLGLTGVQVTDVKLAITDQTTRQVIQSLIPDSGSAIPPFALNANTSTGLSDQDPLLLPHWSGFIAVGVGGLQPRALANNEAYSLVFSLGFPDQPSPDQFASLVRNALAAGPGPSFPFNIATGSGDTSGVPFFGPPHGNI